MRRYFIVIAILFVFENACNLYPAAATQPPLLANCQILPANNIWNTPIDTLPVLAESDQYITSIGRTTGVHADFGSGTWNGGPIGIPITLVSNSQPFVPVAFDYTEESDAGPYPVPANAAIEGGPQSNGDRHILVLNQNTCRLYELYYAWPQQDGSWNAGSGVIYDLTSNALRPDGWTSADAAGLPILPGLVRYEEVAAGEIRHAIRFTVSHTKKAHVWPARHDASSLTGSQYPPMGQRFRLKASVNISTYSAPVQVILTAMKKYGIILADNGSNWFISGVPDSRWNNDTLQELRNISGNDFEAVDCQTLMVDPNSGQVGQSVQTGGGVNIPPSIYVLLLD
jgi:hypothetical protein